MVKRRICFAVLFFFFFFCRGSFAARHVLSSIGSSCSRRTWRSPAYKARAWSLCRKLRTPAFCDDADPAALLRSREGSLARLRWDRALRPHRIRESWLARIAAAADGCCFCCCCLTSRSRLPRKTSDSYLHCATQPCRLHRALFRSPDECENRPRNS